MPTARTGAIAVIIAASLLAGCQSSRLGALNTPVASAPEPLPAAPSGVVVQNQLPPPSTPAATPGQFPSAPPPPEPATTDPVTGGGTQVASAGSGGPVSAGQVAGVWNASVAGQSCRIATPQTSFGPGFRAAPLGCPAPLTGLKAWAAKGSQLVLYDEGGNQIATLYSSGGSRFDGQTSTGSAISLTR